MVILYCVTTKGQVSPNLEFSAISGVQNPQGNGPVTSVTINFVKNINNPSGTSYESYFPNLKADFVISNQQYNSAALIGYNINSESVPVFPKMNYIGAPGNSDFTSSGASAGTGINVNSNRGVTIFYNTSVLIGKPTAVLYRMADLTITFNRPVDNPILHIGALGAFSNNLGLAGSFDLVSSNVPISFSKVSGNNNNFSVTATSIKNISPHPHDMGIESASGSVKVQGTGLTTMTLRMYVKGDGGEASWPSGSGDLVTIGVSMLESDLQVIETIDNPSPHVGDIVKLTVQAKNNGSSNNSNVKVTQLLGFGYALLNVSTTSGSYNIGTGVWEIGSLNDHSSEYMTITVKVKSTGSYNATSVISGSLNDPIPANNSSSTSASILKSIPCYNDFNNTTIGSDSRFGITLLKRAGEQDDNWPMVRKSSHLVLESNKKGFVITRIAKSSLQNIAVPQEGMIIYDTEDKCLKIYSDSTWSCFSTPACS